MKNYWFHLITLSLVICLSMQALISQVKAQQLGKINELQAILQADTTDITKVEALLDLFEEYINLEAYKAKEYADNALIIADRANYKEGIANAYEKISVFYLNQGNYNVSLEYLQKSLQVHESSKNLKGIANIWNKLGNFYSRKGEYDEALEYYQKSLKLRQEIGDKEGIAVTLTNLGGFYHIRDNDQKALEYYLQALSIANEIHNRKIAAINQHQIAEIYAKQFNYHQAIYYYKLELEQARTMNDNQTLAKAYLGLAEAYRHLGNYKRAFEYYQLHSNIRDAITKQDALDKINLIKKSNDDAKRQQEMRLREKQQREEREQERRRYFNYLLLMASVLLSITAYIFFRSNQQNKRINRILEKQKAEIEEKTRELTIQKAALEEQSKAIAKKNEELEITFSEIEKKNKDITSSINYAKRIQDSMLPFAEKITEHLPKNFILFRPRDIVSGDFYWFAEIEGKIILAALDCTGHGVPGAIMSMLGNTYLNQIINLQRITSPDKILIELHNNIRKALKQEETRNQDGMDVAMCVINKAQKQLLFAGASSPLCIVQNGVMEVVESSKLPVGGFQQDREREFTLHTFDISIETTFYIFSDGYQDQFGGPKGRKFAKNRLRDLLFEIHTKPMEEQKQILEDTLVDWMQDNRQMDDIMIIGVKIDEAFYAKP
ncbi:MAG: tetratricopeptide repeat protein [Microscillaceae bacterium]|nr:tetratricopeptide repeat protein [Microscillaceae bacterium]MDW8460463.1 tetratricopeptide repeat protein [Cytophagales bacterium]